MTLRWRIALLSLTLIGLVTVSALPPWVFAADSAVKVTLNADPATPREVEEATSAAITRDYSRAWQSLAQALSENRVDVLNQSFTGPAKDKLSQAVSDQQKEGLKRRYIDRGHKVDVIFYSVEGSAIELRDTAQFEIQWLDGDKVIHSEQATLHYLALLTPGENSWRVRVLENVPAS